MDNLRAATGKDAAARFCTAWPKLKPGRRDFWRVVTELSASKFVGEGGVFGQGPHVSVTYMGCLRPPVRTFLSYIRPKDCRSAKKRECVNGAGVWAEMATTAVLVARAESGSVEDVGRYLGLAERLLMAPVEVCVRAQLFWGVVEQGVEAARQMPFIVKQGQDAVSSES